MLTEDIDAFMEENPLATTDDFKEHFGNIADFRDTVFSEANPEYLEEKLNSTKLIKKAVFFIMILAAILAAVYFGTIIKNYIDVQNAIDTYKIITIE
jgi:hypothetical protein